MEAKLNFVSRWVLLLGCFVTFSALHAEGETFNISAPIPDDMLTQTGKFAMDLKHQAVVNWLKSEMKDKYAAVEEKVTPEFTEKYVLDFTRRKFFSGKPFMEVKGHLDSKGLKEWARIASVKSESTSLNPLLVLSSDFPDNSISPESTSEKVESSKYAKIVRTLLDASLAKLNVNLKIVPFTRFPLSKPARTKNEIAALREIGLSTDSKTALWVHLSSCYSCGGAKLDLYLYNFDQSRIATADTEDLALAQSDMASEARLNETLAKPISDFVQRLEQVISKGALFSSVFHLVVKGIPYTSHNVLEDALAKLDYVVRISLRSMEPDGAEFEVMSSVGPAEFSERLGRSQFSGFNLKVLKIDSDALTVRYWKPGSSS
ncbi:MAG: hypothetical protein H6617_11740 [Bdellovibrionaceae bacterium]|nr:hypothetical protein [Pseudobdellovibrionaceae bacterium]